MSRQYQRFLFARSAVWFAVVLASTLLAAAPALAHRFNVAILAPAAGVADPDFNQFRSGFMLATTERDAHANEESDGHLGGLDVYVALIDETAPLGPDALEAEIVVVYSARTQAGLIMAVQARGIPILMMPGDTPFERAPGSAAVSAFSGAYVNAYGTQPTVFSAHGYTAARRIDEAVRAQGGVADRTALLASFGQSAKNFSW
jgi:hypothetical protein